VKKFLCLILFALSVCLSASAQTQTTVRVNCGGAQYTDSKGNIWKADFGFSGGKEINNTGSISGTPDPTLFNTYHWDPGNYTLQVPNGKYQVNLYFAEATPSDEKIGARVFNVLVQGAVAFSNLDVFREVGAGTALIKSTTASVTNGTIKIGFDYESGSEPQVSAIEILPASTTLSGPTLTLSFKYPDGTAVLGALNYAVTSSLLSFKGSQALVNGLVEADLFANPSAMGISTQFSVTLSLTDTSGNTLWQMNLGMNPAQVNLGAVQSSAMNVIVQKM
jgi:Malectin domain